MSYFDQLLSQPLPSASAMFESGDEMDKEINDAMKAFDEGCSSRAYSEGCGSKAYSEGCKSNCEEGDEIDKELAELERECSVNGDLDDDDDDDYEMDDDEEEEDDDEEEEAESKYRMPTSVDDPTPAEPVDAEDDAEADHAMNLAATPMLLQEELTEADCGKMCESGEMDILVDEGFMMEADIGLLGYEGEDFMEGVFAPESRPFKMTKKARFQQLYALSLQIEARAHHDPFYPKMQKAYKIERTIKKGWEKRYGALAKRRALKYLKRLSKSKSPTVKKIVSKMVKK